MLVFFVLGLGGEWRFLSHWGGGGGFDGDSCGMIAVACLMERRRRRLRGRRARHSALEYLMRWFQYLSTLPNWCK